MATERGAGGPGARSLASVAGEHVGLVGTLLLTPWWVRKLCGNCELRPMNRHPVRRPGGVVWVS